jgi:hypothetical protein
MHAYIQAYTLLFYIIITTILMNIIFGVIIDTFAELRAKKDTIDRWGIYRTQTQTNTCAHTYIHHKFLLASLATGSSDGNHCTIDRQVAAP